MPKFILNEKSGGYEIQIGGLYRNLKTKKNDAWVFQFAYFYTIEKKKEKATRAIGVPEF